MHGHGSRDEGEGRYICKFPMNLPHEEFARQNALLKIELFSFLSYLPLWCLDTSPDIRQYAISPADFQIDQQADPQVPPSYFEHAVYLQKGALACPVGVLLRCCASHKAGFIFRFVLEQVQQQQQQQQQQQ